MTDTNYRDNETKLSKDEVLNEHLEIIERRLSTLSATEEHLASMAWMMKVFFVVWAISEVISLLGLFFRK